MHAVTRLAWFSPFPPARSGISAYSAELVPLLAGRFDIDAFDEARAHDFVWKHRTHPYDLVVYQLGNSAFHDYQWAYLARYPGLVVLHDGQLHQSRALSLLRRGRRNDYREELAFSHPQAPARLADLVISGLGGSLYFLWPMLGVVMAAARAVAVHHAVLADDLRRRFPGASVDVVRMGVPRVPAGPGARERILDRHRIARDALVFACYGKVTAEKRIGVVLRALARVSRLHARAHLLVVGEAGDDYDVGRAARGAGVADRITLSGFVEDGKLPDYLAAADVCVCLRWPTAGETSASWLRCLAAGKPTIVTDLRHMADAPGLDAVRAAGTGAGPGREPVPEPICVRVDLLDEERSLALAMTRLASDPRLREELGRNALDYWRTHHTLEAMRDDYERLLQRAVTAPDPDRRLLPRHFNDDATGLARRLAEPFGANLDFLGR